MHPRFKPLSRQVVVITGATSGIGLATTKLAAARGARVVLTARSQEGLAAVAAQLDIGERCLAAAADVGSRADVEAIAEATIAMFGGFDMRQPALDMSLASAAAFHLGAP